MNGDPLAIALFQWEEGRRRLDELRSNPELAQVADRVLAAIEDELRRRIGSTYTAVELVALYERGTDWCLEVALRAAPGDQAALNAQSIADAAFFEHLRRATDYAGGRQIEPEEGEGGDDVGA